MFCFVLFYRTFPLSYFCMTKSTKSQQGGLASSSFRTSCGVHELVAGSSAWRVCTARSKAKIDNFVLSAISAIPRVRTYHTKEPSRFVHALSARPLKVQGGREWSKYADGIIKINPISLCSHQDTHPNFNREVRHSPTWHSSESESARGRFEPVTMVKLERDGRGTLFAPVAARRQKEFKRGILSSFCPFRSFRTSEKNTNRTVSLCLFAGERCSPLLSKARISPTDKIKIKSLPAFSSREQARRKSYQKEVPCKLSRSAECDKGSAPLNPQASPKA